MCKVELIFYRAEQHNEQWGNTLLFKRKMWEAKTTTRFCNKNVQGFSETQATLLTNSHHASRLKLLPLSCAGNVYGTDCHTLVYTRHSVQ